MISRTVLSMHSNVYWMLYWSKSRFLIMYNFLSNLKSADQDPYFNGILAFHRKFICISNNLPCCKDKLYFDFNFGSAFLIQKAFNFSFVSVINGISLSTKRLTIPRFAKTINTA